MGNSTQRDIILKSRQLGFSTCILGEKFLKCLSKRNTRAVVIAHDHQSTEKLFNHVHFFTKYCKLPVETDRASKHELSFPQTDSVFYVGTAGSREFGRGDTITDLHCSEFAFWPNPERIVRGLFQAVPKTGNIVIESTANGQGNSYHRRCLRSLSGDSVWKLHFYPWYIATEYTIQTNEESFHPTPEEEEYAAKVYDATSYALTAGQLLWRRSKLEEFGEDRQLGITPEMYFDQEYPYNAESAFLASGFGIFAQLGLQPSPLPSTHSSTPPLTTYIPPIPGAQYVIGADPAEGLMLDESVAQVVRVGVVPEVVAEYASGTIKPDELAYELASLGKRYNDALIVVERNNHGIATLSHLKRVYPYGLIYKERRLGKANIYDDEGEMLGIRTTTNKAKMVDDLYAALREGMKYYSTLLHDELMSFIEVRSETGRILLKAQDGCMDNRVMSLVMAIQGVNSFNRAYVEMPKKVVPYTSVLATRERIKKGNKRKSLRDSFFAGIRYV